MSAIYCENGHFVDAVPKKPDYMVRTGRMDQQFREDLARLAFCAQCGGPALDRCPACKARIGFEMKRPSYCGACAEPFPWTRVALEAAKEYTDELKGLGEGDKTMLKETFSDLTVETAKTPLAGSRFKKYLVKMGPSAASVLTKILGDVMTAEIKRQCGLG
jgi:hypothetical protein